MSGRGVVYVAYGEAAQLEATLSMQSLLLWNSLPVTVIGERHEDMRVMGADCAEMEQVDPGGRWAKISLDRLSPYELTLYIDADTRPHGDLSAGFEMLEDGWEMVIAPSPMQGDDLLWHIGEEERAATLGELGFEPLQLQAGLMFVRRCEAVRRLFGAWRCEWLRYRDQDQAALLRALAAAPVKILLLGRPWNGGALVGHRCGAIRRAN